MDKEIVWNIVNSILASSLIICGALTAGNITWDSIIIAIIAGFIVGINQFKNYWESEKEEYYGKRFSFI